MFKRVWEIIKDIIINILFIAVIVIVLTVIFYDKISLTKMIPESEDYMLTDSMQQELGDKEIEDTQEVIVNYYIDKTDLKKYEKLNEYNKGKSNPFAEIIDDTSNGGSSNEDSNNSSSTTNNNSGNFYEDDGTK